MRDSKRAVKRAIEGLTAVQSDLTSLENEEVRITALRLAEWFVKNELIVDEDDELGSILWDRVNAYRQARRREEERDGKS